LIINQTKKGRETMNINFQKLLSFKNLAKTIFAIGVPVWGGSVAVHTFYKEELDFNLIEKLCTPVAAFTMLFLLLISTILFFIYFDKYNAITNKSDSSLKRKANESQSTDSSDKKSDSIMEILNSAQPSEVIKVGTALSDVLWTTSRKELRIKVGEKVRAAAKTLAADAHSKDEKKEARRIEAHVMIEDIGNTTMCLNHKNVDSAIRYIQEGLRIANNHGFHYESARGHRNLANCYALKEDNDAANNELEKAKEAMEKILNEKEKAQIAFDISYAQAKIYRNTNRQEAINALKQCLAIYEMQDTAAKLSYADRVVKIYREMGVIYQLMHKEHYNTIDAFETARKFATERQNHEDIVRCCTALINLHVNHYSPGLDGCIEGHISEAEKHINKVDTIEHIQEFNKAKNAWEEKKKTLDEEKNKTSDEKKKKTSDDDKPKK
jgi:tetratricopeptide (TPR) repeat protein